MIHTFQQTVMMTQLKFNLICNKVSTMNILTMLILYANNIIVLWFIIIETLFTCELCQTPKMHKIQHPWHHCDQYSVARQCFLMLFTPGDFVEMVSNKPITIWGYGCSRVILFWAKHASNSITACKKMSFCWPWEGYEVISRFFSLPSINKQYGLVAKLLFNMSASGLHLSRQISSWKQGIFG